MLGTPKLSPKITYRFTAALRPDEAHRTWVSCCPELNLFSQATTMDDAVEALRATVLSWIKHCSEQGILDDSLRRRGWSVTESNPGDHLVVDGIELKKYPHTRELNVDVPLYLIADAAKAGQIGNGSCTS